MSCFGVYDSVSLKIQNIFLKAGKGYRPQDYVMIFLIPWWMPNCTAFLRLADVLCRQGVRRSTQSPEDVAKTLEMCKQIATTLPRFNMEPENGTLE